MKAIAIRSNRCAVSAILFLATSLFGLTVQGQTYSPYTPDQLQEFNHQPLSPAEGPFGPVESPSVPEQRPSTLDSRYLKNPDGEEQAEGQGTESATPFVPIPSTITF